MWHASGFLLALWAAGVGAADHLRQTATPVQKVVDLLVRLRDQVQKEGQAEAVNYDKFSCFCKEHMSNKQYEIDRSKVKTDALDAAIASLQSEVAKLDGDIVSRRADLETERTAAAAALEARTAEQTTYEKNRATLVEAVAAAEDALKVLKLSREGASGAKAASLLARSRRQVAVRLADKVPPAARQVLLAAAGLAAQDPSSDDYHSNDIVASVAEILKTFKAELAELDEEGATNRHTFNMVEGARANKVKAIQKEVDNKERLSSQKGQELGEKQAILTQETAARTADESFLADLTRQCEAKATAWDERSKTRASEITAITEALDLLKGTGALYGANKKLVGLLATRKQGSGSRPPVRPINLRAPSFLQLTPVRPVRLLSLVGILEKDAAALKSPALAALAAQARLGGDHFEQVRTLIKDLIARLEGEAAEEATQKTFCDESMAAAVAKRDEKRGEVERHSASIAMTQSQIDSLSGEITELARETAELHKALNEMTELRSTEKAQNAKTVADAEAGSAAVKQAIEVLQKFYEPASLLQQKRKVRFVPENASRDGTTVADLAPATFTGDYSGKRDASKGIIGLLDVIASDFDRTVTSTQEAESKAEADFTAQSAEINAQIDAKKATQEAKESEKETKAAALTGFQDSLQDSSKLHAEALVELEKLSASCVDAGESWEERQRHRQQEVEALKNAMQILTDWKG